MSYFTDKAGRTDLRLYFPTFYILGNEGKYMSQGNSYSLFERGGIVSVFFRWCMYLSFVKPSFNISVKNVLENWMSLYFKSPHLAERAM